MCLTPHSASLLHKDFYKSKHNFFPLLPPNPGDCCDTGTLTQEMIMYGQGRHSDRTMSKKSVARDAHGQGRKQGNGSHWATQVSSETDHYQQSKERLLGQWQVSETRRHCLIKVTDEYLGSSLTLIACPKNPFPSTSPWIRSQGRKICWEQLEEERRDSERLMSRLRRSGSFGELGPGDLEMLLLRLESKRNEKVREVVRKLYESTYTIINS